MLHGLLFGGSHMGGWAQSPGEVEKVTLLFLDSQTLLSVGGKILPLGRELLIFSGTGWIFSSFERLYCLFR